jgi:alkylation response protein AidB-like acyl-CoA dehydrogenase
VEFDLTESQRHRFDEVVQLTRKSVTAPERDAGIPSRARWTSACTAGLAGVIVPARSADQDAAGATDLSLAMQALGYGCADAAMSLALSCHLFGGVLPLSRWGMPEQQTAYLPRLTSGEWYAARAVRGVVQAKSGGAGFQLSGVADLASAGLKPDLVLVFAQVSDSPAASTRAFFIPLAEVSGITWERSQGSALACADSLRLDHASVPNNMIMGSGLEGDALLAELLPREQLALQSVRLGLLQQLLETALGAAGKYARRLKLKGVPPQGYQMLGHKLADFKIRFDATELLLRRAAWQLERRGVAAAETALAGLAIETSLLPGAFEVVRLQRDYALDENQAWANLLSSVVEYGRYMLNPVQMRTSVNEAIQPGVA